MSIELVWNKHVEVGLLLKAVNDQILLFKTARSSGPGRQPMSTRIFEAWEAEKCSWSGACRIGHRPTIASTSLNQGFPETGALSQILRGQAAARDTIALHPLPQLLGESVNELCLPRLRLDR
jgi:hypothetical protein